MRETLKSHCQSSLFLKTKIKAEKYKNKNIKNTTPAARSIFPQKLCWKAMPKIADKKYTKIKIKKAHHKGETLKDIFFFIKNKTKNNNKTNKTIILKNNALVVIKG